MFKFTFIPLLWSVVNTQSNRDLYNGQFVNEYQNGEYRRPYNDPRDTRLPSPGDSDYRTYVYNNRRYGLDPSRYNSPFNPNINQPGGFPYNPIPYNPVNPNPLDDQYKYNVNRDPNNPDALFPGVLGGWREDLQGKERPNSRQLKRDIFVNTNYGQVQGFKVYLYDNPDPDSGYRPWLSPVERIQGEVSVFLGIPYARPPVDEGRFKPPRQHPGWQLLQAVDWGPACPQPVAFTGATKGIRDMDEDCLYLNVFSPTTEAGATAQKYPVMVYIHGGQFQSGASNLFPAHYMAAFYRVVVVSLNYRLGALGFLSTADENSPGNYGILDQAMALRWVYDNIAPFNGDPSSVTLLGPGAGAASAGILAVAPSTRDIVTRVIAQSGSALADWAMIEDQHRAVNTSLTFGRLLGCPIDSSWKLLNCLRHRSFYELGNANLQPWLGFLPWAPVLQRAWALPGDEWYAGWRAADWRLFTGTVQGAVRSRAYNPRLDYMTGPWLGFLPWAPVLQRAWALPGDEWYAGWRAADWRLLEGTVEGAVRSRVYNPRLEYMTGVTTQEAAFVLYNNDSLAPRYEITEEWFENKINEFVLRYNYTLNPKGVYNAIKYMYTYHPDPHNKSAIRDQYIHFLSDFLYRAPTDKMVKLLLDQNVPVYMYVLNTTVEAFNWPEWRRYSHDTEHFFLTGAPFMDPEFFPKKYRIERHMWSGNDRNMSHFFMKAFTDFARYGNPTRERILGMHFEMAKPGELRYLNINTTYNSTIQLNYRQTELAFWTVYLPTVIGRVLPTYPPITEYWWEPARPLQIAFWSVSGVCLLLIVSLAVLCMLWRNAKRETERYNYSDDIFMVGDAGDTATETRSQGNIYEYRDVPVKPHAPTPTPLSRAGSVGTAVSRPASTVTGSAVSLSLQSAPAPAPLPRARPPAALPHQVPHGVPQTTV